MDKSENYFPKKIAWVNALLILILYAITGHDSMLFLPGLIVLWIFLWVIIRVQKTVVGFSSKFIISRYPKQIFILTPALLLIGITLYGHFTRVDSFLQYARLAALPQSAKNIKFYEWHNLFAGERFLSFTAPSEAVMDFINASESLVDSEVVVYSESYPRIPYSKEVEFQDWRSDVDYYVPETGAPVWWDEELRGAGRKYEIPSDANGHWWGYVIYNEATGTVYIKITWS